MGEPPTAVASPPVRLSWIDYGKAAAIVLVVFGHASRSIGRSDGLMWSENLRLADALIYSFHISLFFILAGVTAGLAAARNPRDRVRGLIWGIAVPFVVWSAAWVLLKMSFPDAVNHPLGMSALLKALWLPVEHMWFLQFLLVARLIWMSAEGGGAAAPASPWGTALIAVLLAAGILLGPMDGGWNTVAAMLFNAGLVGIGLLWVPVLERGRSSPILAWTALLAFAGWLAIVTGLRPADDLSLASLIATLAGSFVALVLVWQLREPQSLGARIAAFIGEASLAIYVLHAIIIAALRVALSKAGLLDEVNLLLGGTILGVVLPAVVYWLALDVSARTGLPLTRWIGLGTATRSHCLPVGAGLVRPRPHAPARP